MMLMVVMCLNVLGGVLSRKLAPFQGHPSVFVYKSRHSKIRFASYIYNLL